MTRISEVGLAKKVAPAPTFKSPENKLRHLNCLRVLPIKNPKRAIMFTVIFYLLYLYL